MPQTNTLRRKGKKKKSTKFIDKKVSIRDMAKGVSSLWNQVLEIKGIINAEKKFFDTTVGATYDYNGAVNCLTLIPGGSAMQQRNGNSVFLKGISLRGSVLLDSLSAATAIRILIFQDLDCDPGTVTAGNVLETLGSVNAPYAPIDNVNRRRFKIYTTKMITLSTGGDSLYPLKMWLPLKTHCRWNSSTGSDINKGHIYTLIVSDRATYMPTVRYVARAHYYDN